MDLVCPVCREDRDLFIYTSDVVPYKVTGVECGSCGYKGTANDFTVDPVSFNVDEFLGTMDWDL